MPASALQLQILNFLKQFLDAVRDWSSAMQNVKALNTRKGQDAIMTRRRDLTHRTPCKNSQLLCIVSLVMEASKQKVVPLDVMRR